ncbi:Carnitinyl-CoA dehydratase [subsurface metagenome]
MKAEEAFKIGLVNRVVPHEDLQKEAKSLADSIAAKSPLAISMGREALIHTQDMELMKSIKYLQYMVTTLMGSEDAKEGISSFLEKRKPIWKNK